MKGLLFRVVVLSKKARDYRRFQRSCPVDIQGLEV